MVSEQTSKNELLEKLRRLVPGTTSIDNCEKLEYCFEKQVRICGDIKAVCIRCYERGEVIGGIAFPFGLKLGTDIEKKNPIMIYRFGQADSYMTGIEGKGFDDIITKFEKEPVIREITEKTQLIRKEKKEFEDEQTVEAFKRSEANVLVIRRNKLGEYEDLDKKLIEVAKEKEKETGVKIKIIDENELAKNFYLLGIENKTLIKKLEMDAKMICDADERLFILVSPGNYKGKHKGVLTINSLEDDIFEVNVEKDRLKEYFMKKYGEGLCFINNITF